MKALKFYFLCGLFFLGTGVVTSCGDDDEDYGEASTTAGVIKTQDGKVRVYRAGDYQFFYKDNGQLDHYTYWGETTEFKYNPDKIIDENGDREFKVYYTSQGYIAKASFSDGGDKGTATFSYDGDGHLTSIVFNGEESGYDDGEYYHETGTETVKLTWKNGLLTKMTVEEVWKEGKEVDKDKDTYEYEYDEDYPNPYCQYTGTILYEFDTDFEELGFVGLYGVGPKKLPSSMTEIDDDGDTYTRNLSYQFNEDGTLHYADGDYYYYDEISADDTPSIFKSPRKTVERKGFFSRMAKRHNQQ